MSENCIDGLIPLDVVVSTKSRGGSGSGRGSGGGRGSGSGSVQEVGCD